MFEHVFMGQSIGSGTLASEAFYMCLYWAIYWQCATSDSSVLNDVMGRNILAV